MKAVIRCAQKKEGRAVTLNLSPTFEQFLCMSSNPMREVGKRMNKELISKGMAGLPVYLTLEVSPEGRLHLHGVTIPGDQALDAIKTAMRKAVGCVTGRKGSRQLLCKPISNPDGWHRYITQDERITRQYLDLPNETRLHWNSRPMLQLARNHHNEFFRSAPSNLSVAHPARAG